MNIITLRMARSVISLVFLTPLLWIGHACCTPPNIQLPACDNCFPSSISSSSPVSPLTKIFNRLELRNTLQRSDKLPCGDIECTLKDLKVATSPKSQFELRVSEPPNVINEGDASPRSSSISVLGDASPKASPPPSPSGGTQFRRNARRLPMLQDMVEAKLKVFGDMSDELSPVTVKTDNPMPIPEEPVVPSDSMSNPTIIRSDIDVSPRISFASVVGNSLDRILEIVRRGKILQENLDSALDLGPKEMLKCRRLRWHLETGIDEMRWDLASIKDTLPASDLATKESNEAFDRLSDLEQIVDAEKRSGIEQSLDYWASMNRRLADEKLEASTLYLSALKLQFDVLKSLHSAVGIATELKKIMMIDSDSEGEESLQEILDWTRKEISKHGRSRRVRFSKESFDWPS